MAASANINDILFQAKKLDKDDQLTLLERLVQLVKKNQNKSTLPMHLTALSGLGSETWKDIDIDKYLEEERQW